MKIKDFRYEEDYVILCKREFYYRKKTLNNYKFKDRFMTWHLSIYYDTGDDLIIVFNAQFKNYFKEEDIKRFAKDIVNERIEQLEEHLSKENDYE